MSFSHIHIIQFSGQVGDGPRGNGAVIGGSGSNIGGDRQPWVNPNQHDRINWDDPSIRRKISLTVEFTVVNQEDLDDTDSSEPWITTEYNADNQAEACPEQANCDQWWWVKFTTADRDTGVLFVDMDKSKSTGGNGRPDFDTTPTEHVYYR